MKSIKDFYLQHYRYLGLYFLIYLLVYGFISLRFGMSMDECCDVDSPKYEGPLVFLACGRWFLAFYRWAFGYGACPVISGIMAGVFLSHALVLQTGLLKVRSTLGRYAYGVLYLCIMQWIWVERFSMITDGLGLACLLCTVAVIMLQKPGWRALTAAAALVCCSIASFQVFFLYFATLWLAVELQNCVSGETAPRLARAIRPIAAVALASAAWIVFKHIAIAACAVPESVLDTTWAYNSNMTGWANFLDLGVHDQLTCLGHHVKYSGLAVCWENLTGQVHTGQWVYTTALLPALLLTYMMWKRHGAADGCKFALYTACLLYLPFSIALILLWSWAPVRIFVAEPLVPATLWAIWLETARLRDHTRVILLAGIAFVNVKGMYYGAILGSNEAYYFRVSMQELNHMYLRGQQMALQHGLKDCKIVITGNTRAKMGNDEVMRMRDAGLLLNQASPYAFNNGDAVFDAFARYERLPRLRLATPEEEEKYRSRLQAMGDWPSDTSVTAVDGIILIRLAAPAGE